MSTETSTLHRDQFIPLAEAILDSTEPVKIFDSYQSKDRNYRIEDGRDSLLEELIHAIADCLNHDDYQISANAAIILRNNTILCSRSCDINTIVSQLAVQVDQRSINAAKEAGLALGYILSTRPNDRDLPFWGGTDPMASTSIVKDLDQRRFSNAPVDTGYLHKVTPDTFDTAVNALIENLDRKEYKNSSDWVVAKECAKALGAIGYQRPMFVEDAVPVLSELVKKGDKRQPELIYALTSIGYSRPDLIREDFASVLEELVETSSCAFHLDLRSAAKAGHRKIGHAPVYLGSVGSDSGTDLSVVVEKLYNFMLGKHILPYDEVIQAFVEIYKSRPNELVSLLNKELDRILNNNPRGFDFPDNLMGVLEVLASVDPTNLRPLINSSSEFYRTKSMRHYWYESAFEFNRLVAVEDENLLPNELIGVVKEFLQDENRASVLRDGKRFLKEVDKWDEDLYSTPDGLETINISAMFPDEVLKQLEDSE